MKPLESAEINRRRNGLTDGWWVSGWNETTSIHWIASDGTRSTFYKILAASSYRDPTKKFSLRLKRDVEIRRDIFLIILIGRSLRKIFRIDSFLFFPFPPSLSLPECDSKRNSCKLLEKIKEKKIFSSIGGGSWKRIEISVPVRIGLNVTRHFP